MHRAKRTPFTCAQARWNSCGSCGDDNLKNTTSLAWTIALVLASAAPLAGAAANTKLTLEGVNVATLTGNGSAATLRAQVLLERARFSPGEIDARNGSNTRIAVTGYQKHKGLDPSGKLNEATWTALNADVEPVLVGYAITTEDVAGPFGEIPSDMMEKSKLEALGYSSALEGLAEKFHASPKLLQQLNPGKEFTTAGEELVVPSIAVATPMPKAAKVLVDKSDSTVSLLDAEDKVIAQFPASTGSEHDPLPIGDWKVKGVANNPTFHYNPDLFWDANPEHAKAKIPAGPNNPVGVVWVDLSKEHYGIHGTPEPSKIGKTESHGCIRLTNWSAAELAQAVAPGMPAVLQE